MARGRRVRSAIGWLGLALAVCVVAPGVPAGAQGEPREVKTLWSRARTFRIPVTVPEKDRNLVKELHLVASDDLGASWKKQGRTTPDRPEFSFRAAHDGEYWFAVQTRDVNGRLYPIGDRPIEPTLRVIVDTARPAIVIDARPRRGSDAGVRWEVQDDHLVPKSLTLEYQAEGAKEWKPVPLAPSEMTLIGIKVWDAGTADAIRVRMTAKDRAGNVGVGEQLLPDGLAANPGPAFDSRMAGNPPSVRPIASQGTHSPSADSADDPFSGVDSPPSAAPPQSRPAGRPEVLPSPEDRDFDNGPVASRPSEPAGGAYVAPSEPPRGGGRGGPAPTLLVPSPKFPLRYEVEGAGPDGPATVVLWTTRDGGRSWIRQEPDADRVSPYNVDLGGEGSFGLWLEVRSGSGLGDPAPAPGDPPQSWVEVDSTPPSVALDTPRVGTGPNAGKVVLRWRAEDRHLAPKSVNLFYRADRPEAPWLPIADHLDGTGKHIWVLPAGAPARLHVKAEASDTLGNRGSADSLDFGPVLIDRARPKGRIIGLDQTGGTSRQ